MLLNGPHSKYTEKPNVKRPTPSRFQEKTILASLNTHNSNIGSRVRKSVAEIRQDLNELVRSKHDADKQANDSELIGILTDIRDSLIQTPANEIQQNMLNTGGMMGLVKDIRKSITALQNPIPTNEISPISRTTNQNEYTPDENYKNFPDNVVMKAMMDIRGSLKDLEQDLEKKENPKMNGMLNAVKDIRGSLKLISDTNISDDTSSSLLVRSMNALVRSITDLTMAIKSLLNQLESAKGESIRYKSTRKHKEKRGGKSKNLARKLKHEIEEPAINYQFVLPPIFPPPVYIAPFCIPSNHQNQLPALTDRSHHDA